MFPRAHQAKGSTWIFFIRAAPNIPSVIPGCTGSLGASRASSSWSTQLPPGTHSWNCGTQHLSRSGGTAGRSEHHTGGKGWVPGGKAHQVIRTQQSLHRKVLIAGPPENFLCGHRQAMGCSLSQFSPRRSGQNKTLCHGVTQWLFNICKCSNSLQQTKQGRQSAAGGVAVTGSRQAGMSLGQPSERWAHTGLFKCKSRALWKDSAPNHASRHSPGFHLPLNPSTAAPCACAKEHGRTLLLEKDSNKSFQTALERRGDTTGSKQPPGVTPLLPRRQLHKPGVGTAGNAAQERGSAGAREFLQLIPGRCFSNAPCKAGTLSFNSNTRYSQGTPSPRAAGTTNVRRDTFDGEVKLLLRSYTWTKYSLVDVQTHPSWWIPQLMDEKPPRQNINPCSVFAPAGPSPFAQGQRVKKCWRGWGTRSSSVAH